MKGQIIGNRFEIADLDRDLIGQGGMGDVYRGTDTRTGQLVAVKVLRPVITASDPELHTFRLYSPATADTMYIGNMRFGHSYGYLETDSLETLGPGDWIEETGTMEELPPGETITVSLNWEGLLPYPQPI